VEELRTLSVAMKDQSRKCVYLDHHATTPMDEKVFEKIKPFFFNQFGNPASQSHPYGWHAQDAVNEARTQVARAINAHPTEIIFTSGATESTNMALKGLFFPKPTIFRRHIVTSSIEHGATLSTVKALNACGITSSIVKPQPSGLIHKEQIAEAMAEDTALVSLFFVHNEIGTILPIKDLAQEAKKRGALFHCDAAQALGRVRIDCQELNVDLMSLSGHKIYGPKGVGCLYVRRDIQDLICPLIHGGGQEWYKRSGTLNVPGIVGMGEAAQIAADNFDEENKRIKDLRDRLLKNLMVLYGVSVNGTLTDRVGGNLNVSFAGIDGEELVVAICDRVAISTGSACSSFAHGQSRVLSEIGVAPQLRQAALRFGLGRTTSIEEIDYASEIIVKEVKKQRQIKGKKLIKLVRSN
jgi:cysteine desulfurase